MNQTRAMKPKMRAPVVTMVALTLLTALPVGAEEPSRPPPGGDCLTIGSEPGPATMPFPIVQRYTSPVYGSGVMEWSAGSDGTHNGGTWNFQAVCGLANELLKCLKDPDACKDIEGNPTPEAEFWEGTGAEFDGDAPVEVVISDDASWPAERYTMTVNEFLSWMEPA